MAQHLAASGEVLLTKQIAQMDIVGFGEHSGEGNRRCPGRGNFKDFRNFMGFEIPGKGQVGSDQLSGPTVEQLRLGILTLRQLGPTVVVEERRDRRGKRGEGGHWKEMKWRRGR